jgi:hypothetical protein
VWSRAARGRRARVGLPPDSGFGEVRFSEILSAPRSGQAADGPSGPRRVRIKRRIRNAKCPAGVLIAEQPRLGRHGAIRSPARKRRSHDLQRLREIFGLAVDDLLGARPSGGLLVGDDAVGRRAADP